MRRVQAGSQERETLLIRVARAPGNRQRGIISAAGQTWPCALGRNSMIALKREGDGATPIGMWTLESVHVRRRAGAPILTPLPLRMIRRDDGWCDDPGDASYNRSVRLPTQASAERMWRGDNLYDVVAVLSHNRRPRVRGNGSAIFLHLARPGYEPTEGCVAVDRRAMQQLLRHCRRGARVVIG
ncbi:MAG: L,D-transpeptidase family protein [Pseudomonadota bacterium]|nr:L,D-transpeptidase family protein [Pseudomonadota bacterium]